jgi:hypothetical protein
MIPPSFTVQSYTNKELASYYRCNVKTLRNWLRVFQPELGPRVGNYYSPKQVEIIIDKLGAPEQNR